MTQSTSVRASGGGGTGFVVFVVFLVLKLTHVINWSWWWITAPLWIGIAFSCVMVFLIALVAVPALALTSRKNRRRALETHRNRRR